MKCCRILPLTSLRPFLRPAEPQPSGRRQMVSGGQIEEQREHSVQAELEERNKQLAAEVERNKQLAAEVERNKQLAAEVERNKQLAAEVERNKQLAAEVERNKHLAAEVESLREQLKQKQKVSLSSELESLQERKMLWTLTCHVTCNWKFRRIISCIRFP